MRHMNQEDRARYGDTAPRWMMQLEHLAPEDHAIVGEFLRWEGLPPLFMVSAVQAAPDGVVIVYASWGHITEKASGFWMSETEAEAQALRELADHINQQRRATYERNQQAIEFMSRPE